MQSPELERVSGGSGATWYRLPGSGVTEYIVSTPQTREIVNRPELVGCDYTTLLRDGVTAALGSAPFQAELAAIREEEVCVLHCLRGGLNFGLREALARAFGMNRHTSAFLSSQRYRLADGDWEVREDFYRKLDMSPGTVLFAGDVVATGVTAENGLEVLRDHLLRIGSSLRRLFFVTIGGPRLTRILTQVDGRFRNAFPDFTGSAAIYLEGCFALADRDTPLRIVHPGTDLLRRGALLAPEFAESQGLDPAFPLERCAIYDAGSRAFGIETYLQDVRGYWQAMRGLAEEGVTLAAALEERWPAAERPEVCDFGERLRADDLRELCERRLKALA